MFSTSNFNNVLTERLHRKYPHKVDIKYGLDAGKFNGVKKFPLGNFETHFTSNAKPNVDTYLFNSKHSKHYDDRFDIAVSKKYAPPDAEPYMFDKPVKNPLPQRKNIGSFVSKLYGMPKDKDVMIESTAGQTMNLEHGGLTETKFMLHNYRKEFGGDGRFMDLITGGSPTVAAPVADDTAADDSKADDSKADDSKEETKADHKEVQKTTIKIRVPKVTATPAFQSEPVAEPKTPEPRSQSQQKEPNPMEHRTLLVMSQKDENQEDTQDKSAEKFKIINPQIVAKPVLDKLISFRDNEIPPDDVTDYIRKFMADKGLTLSKKIKKTGTMRTAIVELIKNQQTLEEFVNRHSIEELNQIARTPKNVLDS